MNVGPFAASHLTYLGLKRTGASGEAQTAATTQTPHGEEAARDPRPFPRLRARCGRPRDRRAPNAARRLPAVPVRVTSAAGRSATGQATGESRAQGAAARAGVRGRDSGAATTSATSDRGSRRVRDRRPELRGGTAHTTATRRRQAPRAQTASQLEGAPLLPCSRPSELKPALPARPPPAVQFSI